MQRKGSPKLVSLRVLVLVSFLLVVISGTQMADSASAAATTAAATTESSQPAVHIVYTEQPEGEEPEAYHIRTLASVLGSEDAAREALVYSYKTAASGFSARLTPQQVADISKQPGVLQVVPSRTLQLHSGPGKNAVPSRTLHLHSGPGKLH